MGSCSENERKALSSAQAGASKIKTLNYAPGPLDTKMMEDIVDKLVEPARAEFRRMKAEVRIGCLPPDSLVFKPLSTFHQGKLLLPEDSAKKLVEVLVADIFESGAHLDFFDLP